MKVLRKDEKVLSGVVRGLLARIEVPLTCREEQFGYVEVLSDASRDPIARLAVLCEGEQVPFGFVKGAATVPRRPRA